MTETVTRLRPVLVENRYGGTDKDWTDPETLPIPGCLVAPRMAGEDTGDGREAVVVGWTVYAPPGVDVAPTDRLRVRGGDVEVDGEPEDWSGGFSGWQPGVVVQTRRVDG